MQPELAYLLAQQFIDAPGTLRELVALEENDKANVFLYRIDAGTGGGCAVCPGGDVPVSAGNQKAPAVPWNEKRAESLS